jgi:hypothetical protein
MAHKSPDEPVAVAAPPASPCFVESYDGLRKHKVAWDGTKGRFLVETPPFQWEGFFIRAGKLLKQSFLPENVTPDYYTYTQWRILQRLVSATVSVFGTRALLLALGVKTEMVGAAATFHWIIKDAFGKCGRIMWASKMGRRFDSDAKRWRFRSSLLYAAGTGIEVVTYVFPAAFLMLATAANVLKQMSMLTSSATRNAMYKSFAGDAQNLGDITAKGEAQIAVVDLVGIVLGISVSKMIGTAHLGMALAYILFSVVDVFAIYNEIRAVVFTSLNLERSSLVVRGFVATGATGIPTPNEVSRIERIFLAPAGISYDLFRTPSRTGCSLGQLQRLQRVFDKELFMVTYSAEVGVSILLHNKARDPDILKSLLVWGYFKKECEALREGAGAGAGGAPMPSDEQGAEMLGRAYSKAQSVEETFRDFLAGKGWDVKHMVFGRIKHRTEW